MPTSNSYIDKLEEMRKKNSASDKSNGDDKNIVIVKNQTKIMVPEGAVDKIKDLKKDIAPEGMGPLMGMGLGLGMGPRDGSGPRGQAIRTGAGPDGVVQPNMPTGVLETANGPAMVHEGEQIVPNGPEAVDVIPYQEGNQEQLAQMDMSPGGANVPAEGQPSEVGGIGVKQGYALGGTNIPTGGAMNPMNNLMGGNTAPAATPLANPNVAQQPRGQLQQQDTINKFTSTPGQKAEPYIQGAPKTSTGGTGTAGLIKPSTPIQSIAAPTAVQTNTGQQAIGQQAINVGGTQTSVPKQAEVKQVVPTLQPTSRVLETGAITEGNKKVAQGGEALGGGTLGVPVAVQPPNAPVAVQPPNAPVMDFSTWLASSGYSVDGPDGYTNAQAAYNEYVSANTVADTGTTTTTKPDNMWVGAQEVIGNGLLTFDDFMGSDNKNKYSGLSPDIAYRQYLLDNGYSMNTDGGFTYSEPVGPYGPGGGQTNQIGGGTGVSGNTGGAPKGMTNEAVESKKTAAANAKKNVTADDVADTTGKTKEEVDEEVKQGIIEGKYGYDPLGNLVDFATGESPYYEMIRKQVVNDVNAQGRNELFKGLFGLQSNPNIGGGSANAVMAELGSNANASMADAMGKLGQDKVKRMYDANTALLNEEHYQSTLQKKLEDEGYAKAYERFGKLKAAGLSMDKIKEDPVLARYLEDFLGTSDPAALEAEFGNMNKTWSGTQYSTLGTNAGAIIDNAIQNDISVEDLHSNDTLMNNVSEYLGYGDNFASLTDEQKAEVTKWVDDRYAKGNRTDAEVWADYAIENNIVPAKYKDRDDLKPLLLDLFGKAQREGFIGTDENGNPYIKEGFLYPWEDPDTQYGVYTSWDGKEITMDTSGNPIGPDGKPWGDSTASFGDTTYDDDWAKENIGEDAPGFSNTKAKQIWDSLSPSERLDYYGEDNVMSKDEYERFVKENIYKDFSGTDIGIVDGKVVKNNQEWAQYAADNKQEAADFAEKADKVIDRPTGDDVPETAAGELPVMGTDGKWHVLKTSGGNMQKIWAQFSVMFNDGEPLTPEEFASYWGDGSQWRITNDGYVSNFMYPELTTGDNYAVEDTPDTTDYGDFATPEGRETIKTAYEQGFIAPMAQSDAPRIAKWDSNTGGGEGHAKYELTGEAKTFVNNNKGSMISIGGVPYIIEGGTYSCGNNKNCKDGIYVYDLDGNKKKWNGFTLS